MPCELQIQTPDAKIRGVELDSDKYSLGRAHTNDLCYPEDASLHKEIGLIYFNAKREPHNAYPHFSQSLALDPNQPELASLLRKATSAQSPQIPGLESFQELFPDSTPPGLPKLPGINLP